MWILQWLPNWLFYATLLIGVVGLIATYFIRFIPIPFVYMYKTPIQLASIALIVFGTFMSGAIYDNEAWIAKVKALEEKVAKAEQESKEANIQVETKIVKEKAKIVEKQVLVKQYIDREIVKYDNQCVIPKEFVEAHNQAAKDDRQR